MTSALWIVQKNLGNQTDLIAALHAAGVEHLLIDVVPFSDELPDVPNERPVVLYGETGFITNAHRAVLPTFYDPTTFRFSAYLEHWGKAMLNSDARIVSIESFAAEAHGVDEIFFVRPDADDKSFAGEVIAFGDFKTWYDRISCGGFTIEPSTLIAVAEPTNIRAEWRLHFVGAKCIAATRYRVLGRLSTNEGAPLQVVLFAERLAQAWRPADVWVMDVCETKNGYYVVEANCFNSAGFYAADLECVVEEVTAYAEAHRAAAARTPG